MVEIHFTRIYIIESLQPGDNLTGIDYITIFYSIKPFIIQNLKRY